MSAANPVEHQYKSNQCVYRFSIDNDNSITLKIQDLFQNLLYDRAFQPQVLCFFRVVQRLAKGKFRAVIGDLVAKQLVDKKHLIPASIDVNLKACEKMLEQTIEQFKPKVIASRKEIEAFTCPITFDVFQEPVMDEHGHTFEKSAIEQHLKSRDECPINRQPIRSLTPNLLIQQTIEEWQRQDPIPSFTLFKKENGRLASRNLEMAKTCMEEGEYSDALEHYTKAFHYTKNSELYAKLASLYEKLQDNEKATLAYLYLAKHRLQTGYVHEAIQTLEICQQLPTTPCSSNLILAELYYHTQQPQKAIDLLIKIAKLAQDNRKFEQALNLYERIYKNQSENFLFKPQLKQTAKALEEDRKTQEMIKAYKLLFQLEEKTEYCQKIITGYQTLEKKEQELQWSATKLIMLIKAKQWKQAEEFAKQILQKTQQPEQQVFLYEKLQDIYMLSDQQGLETLWPKLGEGYRKLNQLEAAEKIYTRAYNSFHHLNDVLALADILKDRGKIKASVHTCYQVFAEAMLKEENEAVALCAQKIEQIDPRYKQLDLNQRMNLLSQQKILKLQKQNERLQLEVSKISQMLSQLAQSPTIPLVAFGKAEWVKYFDKIVDEPPLPPNIDHILNSPCPFWPGKKVSDTHMLTLIPDGIGLYALANLLKSPKGGGHASKYGPQGFMRPHDCYQYYSLSAFKSYWALMTKDAIPGSSKRGLEYDSQCRLVKSYRGYEVPKIHEAAISICMERVRSSQDPDKGGFQTICQKEAVAVQPHLQIVAVGWVGGGLRAVANMGHSYIGMACVRRFLVELSVAEMVAGLLT